LEKYVAQTITGNGPTALPQLTAELAIRAAQDPSVPHLVPITAPRYVDPNVAAAVRVIQETSKSVFTAPISLQDAVLNSSLVPSTSSGLARVPAAVTAKNSTAIEAAA